MGETISKKLLRVRIGIVTIAFAVALAAIVAGVFAN